MNTLDLNPLFLRGFELMEHTNKHVFVTGRAGTGKSTLLTYFRSKTKKNIAVLAPTGVAAINVQGQTIHSFFGFKPDITVSKVEKEYKHRKKKGLYKRLDAIIIDEISMVRADLLDCVDVFLRLQGPDKLVPFGGIQMIFIGDLYQLPPVVTSEERRLFSTVYESPYFFSAHVFENLNIELVELNKIYRQTDDAFIDILNAVRNRSITDVMLKRLNSRFDPNFSVPSDKFFICLTTTNAKAREINAQNLAVIPGRTLKYTGYRTGTFNERNLPTAYDLEVKSDAQVMLVNNDRQDRWVNGSVGKIVDIKHENDGDILMVELTEGVVVEVTPFTWEMFRFVFNNKAGRIESEVVGTFTQYPVMLAWAVTIHKAQGKTFENVIIDMDRGAFVHGQTYVALSRCVSLDGIVLRKRIEKKHILMDWRVVKFLTQYQYNLSEKTLSLRDKMARLENAIDDGKTVSIIYLKANDEKSMRRIHPRMIGEMEYMGKTFLGVEAYDELRKDIRVFRIDRMLKLYIDVES